MPNAKVLSEKQAIVAALADRLQSSSAGVFVDYKGLSVLEDTALRTQLRNGGVEYTVIKNTLTRFAINKIGFEELDPILTGTTSLATSKTDPIAPIRIISEYSKKMNDKFTIKAGFMEGRILSLAEIEELSALSSKEDLYSKLLGTMLAPISALAVVLDQISKLGGEAVTETPEAPEEATEASEAPAEASAEVPAEAITEETVEAAPAAVEAPEAPADEVPEAPAE